MGVHRRWLLGGAAAVVVAVIAVIFVTQRQAGLPRSPTCGDVEPGGTRLRSAPPPAGAPGRGPQDAEEAGQGIDPAFRPATAEAVYCEDLADPFVVVEGRLERRFFAYGTNTDDANVPVLVSGGIARSERLVDALPELPGWSSPGAVWAPGILRREGGFVLYYATTHTASGRQCISAAVGAGAEGPFEDTSTAPLVCPTELGGAIDPSPFVAEDGRAYLLWKSDGNCCGMPTRIYSQPLSDDGLQLTEPPQEVLTSTLPWEAGVVEAPSMVEHDGVHYLFYSGNAWDTAEYAIGYATCETPVGPCTKPLDHPWLGSSAEARGPGGQELFIDPAGDLRMVFHAWLKGVVGYEAGSFRGLHTVGVDFRDGAPVTAQ
jgi:Glycosyl hydrolases family 43